MLIGIGVSADPTKLELAVVASHVVTSLRFFDSSLAWWAEPHIFIFCPFLILIINCIITRPEPSMISASTEEANLLSARADPFLLKFGSCSYVFFASLSRTPFDQRVWVQQFHLFELKVFEVQLIKLMISTQNIFNLIVRESSPTLRLKTRDLQNLWIYDQYF